MIRYVLHVSLISCEISSIRHVDREVTQEWLVHSQAERQAKSADEEASHQERTSAYAAKDGLI